MASSSFLIAVGAWALTYLVHSTLLLGVAALLCTKPLRSPALRERIWKSAAVAGVLTSLLAVFGGWGIAIGERAHAITTVDAVTPAPVPLAVPATLASMPASQATLPKTFMQPPQSVPTGSAIDLTAEEYAALEAVLESDGDPMMAIGGPTVADRHRSLSDPTLVRGANHGNENSLPQELTNPQLAIIAAAASISPAMDAAVASNQLMRATSWLGMVVLFWMTCGTLRLLVQELSLRRLLLSCTELKDGLAAKLLASLSNGQRARLLVSTAVFEPLACGVFEPAIVLPASCEEQFADEELRALLAHELAHLQRGDVRWLCLGRVLCACLGFQPLNHVARRAWQSAAEIQCDDWAIEQDVSALSLARCLATVAEWNLERRSSSAVLTATSNGGPLTLRIERLLSDRVPDIWSTRWRSRLSVLLVFTCGLLFASCGPRLDESLWADGVTDFAEQLRLWGEINSEINAVNSELFELSFKRTHE